MTEEEGKCKDQEEPTHIRCAKCQEIILTVPRRVAEAFSSGKWTCSRETCQRPIGASSPATPPAPTP